EDSGLEVDRLGGAPGVRSARFSAPDPSDAKNNRKLLRPLAPPPGRLRGDAGACGCSSRPRASGRRTGPSARPARRTAGRPRGPNPRPASNRAISGCRTGLWPGRSRRRSVPSPCARAPAARRRGRRPSRIDLRGRGGSRGPCRDSGSPGGGGAQSILSSSMSASSRRPWLNSCSFSSEAENEKAKR
ncbi:MAG: hypothetical protein HGA24_10460, partial [Candidatus Aminicenantes bacterium]|nr:hypothetical protein [Candidatus Aminicenantes bacterium]